MCCSITQNSKYSTLKFIVFENILTCSLGLNTYVRKRQEARVISASV